MHCKKRSPEHLNPERAHWGKRSSTLRKANLHYLKREPLAAMHAYRSLIWQQRQY